MLKFTNEWMVKILMRVCACGVHKPDCELQKGGGESEEELI